MAASTKEDQPDEKTSIISAFNQENSQNAPPPNECSLFSLPKRYILSIMAFLGFCNIYALRVNLSVAIVAMNKNHSIVINDTLVVVVHEFDWTPQLRGLILGSFFYGYILTQLPGGWLSAKIGGKHLFGGGILCTAILTLLTPLCANINVYLLIFIRILEGLFEGVTYPCIHALWMKWAPPLERSKLATIAFSGSYIGTVLAFPLSGVIADSLGWAWIFYIFGILAIVWYVLWVWLVTESPGDHSTISHAELEYIQHSIGFTQQQVKGQRIPWKNILTSLPVWSIVVAHFAENWGFYTLLTELPTFLNDVMHYDVYQAGFVAAVPYLVMAIMVQVGGQLADVIRSKDLMSTTSTRKVFNCMAFFFQTVFMLFTAYTMKPAAAVTCITFAVGCGGFAWAGFSVNHLDIAPQFASLLMGVSNTFATIPGIISPALTGHIAADRTANEWRIIFYLAGTIYCIGAIFYAFFASGERQPWAEIQSGYAPHVDDTVDETEE